MADKCKKDAQLKGRKYYCVFFMGDTWLRCIGEHNFYSLSVFGATLSSKNMNNALVEVKRHMTTVSKGNLNLITVLALLEGEFDWNLDISTYIELFDTNFYS